MAISVVSFSFSRVAQPEARGSSFSGCCFLYRILSPTGLISKLSIGGPEAPSAGCWLSLPHFSPTGLVSKLTDFLSSSSYINVQRPLLLVGVTIALIQPIHGQGYNSDIPRPDTPVIYIGAFPILTARSGRRSVYNNMCNTYVPRRPYYAQ